METQCTRICEMQKKAGLRGKYVTPILRSKKIPNKEPNSTSLRKKKEQIKSKFSKRKEKIKIRMEIK